MSKKKNNNEIEEELFFANSVIENMEKDEKPFEDVILSRIQKVTDILSYVYGNDVTDSGVPYRAMEIDNLLEERFHYTMNKVFDLIDIDINETIEDKKKYYKKLKEEKNEQ